MFPNVIPPKPVEDTFTSTNLDAVADALAAQYKASQQAAEPDLDLVADGLAGEFKKAGGMTVETMDEATRQRIAEVERSATGEKGPGPIGAAVQYGKTLGGGFYKGAAGLASTLDSYSNKLAKFASGLTGIPEDKLRGGLFEGLSKNWSSLSERLKTEGTSVPILKDVLAGVGSAAFDVPTIMALGKFGLPIHGAIMGGAEGGLRGAAVGAATGALTHGAIKGIGALPSRARLPAWFTFGAVTEPGSIEDKVTAGLTWTALGFSGRKEPLPFSEFIKAYPKIKDKIDNARARKIIQEAFPEAKPTPPAETGDKAILDEMVRYYSENAKMAEGVEGAASPITTMDRPKLEARLESLEKTSARVPEQIETWPERAARERVGAEEAASSEAIRAGLEAQATEAQGARHNRRLALLKKGGIILKKGWPTDAPDIDYDIMLVTEGRGIGQFKKPGGGKLEVEEWEDIPKHLRNPNSKFNLERVAEGLSEGLMMEKEDVRDYRFETGDELLAYLASHRRASKSPVEEKLEMEVDPRTLADDAIAKIIADETARLPKAARPLADAAEDLTNDPVAMRGIRGLFEDVVSGKTTYAEAERAARGAIWKLFKTGPEEGPVPEFDVEPTPPPTPTAPPAATGKGPSFIIEFGGKPVAKYWSREQALEALENLAFPEYRGESVYIVGPDGKMTEAPAPKVTYQKTPGEVPEGEAPPTPVAPEKPVAPEPTPVVPKAKAKPVGEALPFEGFDAAFTKIAKDLGIKPEQLGTIYQRAVEDFTVPEGADPVEKLRNYVSSYAADMRKGLIDEASGKKEREALPIEEGVEQKSAIEGRETPEAETWQERVVGIMKKVATPDELSDMEDRMAGVPWRKLRTVQEGKYGVKKAQSQLSRMAPRASMIEKAHADPEIRRQMAERYDALNAKKEKNEPLSKEEMEEWAVTGAIKDGLKYMNLGPAPDIKGAEEALSKMAESMKPFVQDVASAGKESLRDKAQNLRELVRIPIRNKVTMPLAEAMVGVDNERDTATAKADRTSKPYLELQRSDKAGLARVDEALWEGDKSRSIISDAELRSKFKLNDREISAYKGIRTAYKLMAEYEMAKNKAGLKKVYDRLMRKVRSGEEQEEVEANYQEALKNVDQSYRNNPGYIPHMRTGRYAVLIKGELLRDPDQGKLGMEGEKELPKKPITAEWAWFEHESQARRHAAEYKVGQEVDFEGRRFRITEIGDPQDMSKAKLTPQGFVQAMYAFPVYEKMLEKKGAEFEDIQKLERILGEETMKYYAKGRLARRRNIAGWDKDIGKSTERFFQEFPRAVSRRYAIGDLEKMVDKLPANERDYGRKLLNYWAGREQGQGILSGEEGKVSQGLRKFFYTWFLGLKPAFYFNNATQSIQTTLPLAQSMVGLKKAGLIWGKEMGKTALIVKDWLAQRTKTRHVDLLDVIKNARYLSVAEKRALASVWEEGGIGASRTKEIIGGKGKITKVMEAAGTLSEKQNRIHATLVGVAIAKSKQMNTAQAIDLARRFTGKSQFVYSKANRMEAMRGAMATPLIFKSYFANYWKLQGELFKENKPAFLTSQAILLGLAGAAGYPLAKESFDLVIHGLRAVGVLDDEENFRKQVYDIQRTVDKNTAGVVLHGLPALVDIDGDTIYGSGGIIGLAPMQVIKSVSRGASGILHPRGADWPERIARMSPTFIRNAIRFVQMVKDEKWPTDEYGKPRLTESYLRSLPPDLEKWARENQADWPSVKDVPMLTKLLGGAGFPISPRREVQEGAYTVKSVARQVREEKGGFNREIGKFIGENLESDRVIRQLMAKDREGHYLIGGGTFRGYYRKIKGMLPEKIRQAIDRAQDEAKKKGYEINYQSILTNIRDYLEGRE